MKDALKSKLKATCSEETYDCITILKTPRRDSGLLEPSREPEHSITRQLKPKSSVRARLCQSLSNLTSLEVLHVGELRRELREAKIEVEAIMSLESLIGGLSRDEQIVAMELLWKRLTTEDPSAAPPDWHRSVVAERVAAIERGEESLSDWADAKRRLADRLR